MVRSSAWWSDITSQLCPRAGGIFANSLVWLSFEEECTFSSTWRMSKRNPCIVAFHIFVGCFVEMFLVVTLWFSIFPFALDLFSVVLCHCKVSGTQKTLKKWVNVCMCVLYGILSITRVRCKWKTVS